MALRSRNYVDKSLWNVANGALNGVMVGTIGELSTLLANIVFGSQEDVGKKIAVNAQQIGSYTNLTNGTLFEGVYQVVQIDSAATVASCGVGMAAYHLFSNSNINVVTSFDKAQNTVFNAGVFLTPLPVAGSYTVIFVGGGRVNVAYKTGLTNGAPAIGDNINFNVAAGLFDDVAGAATGTTSYFFGNATILPVSAGLGAVYVNSVIDRI